MNNFKEMSKESKICCEVTNCVYHCDDNKCCATVVKVGPKEACNCHQTECGTFEEKPE